MKLILFCSLFLIFSCVENSTKTKEEIQKTSTIYLTEKLKTIDVSIKLDSTRIIDIDTISTKKDFFYKINILKDSVIRLSKIAEKKYEIANASKATYNNLLYMGNLSVEASRIAGTNNETKNDLSIFKKDALDKLNEANNVDKQISFIAKTVDSLTAIYKQNKLDSTNFLCYLTKLYVCYSEKNLSQNCDTVFLKVSKDFRVLEK